MVHFSMHWCFVFSGKEIEREQEIDSERGQEKEWKERKR